MPVALTIEPRGLDKVGRTLRAIERKTGDLRPILKLAAEFMKRDTSKNFRLSQDPVTRARWARRSPASEAVPGVSGRRLLIRTGALQRSYTKSRPIVTKTTARFGSDQRHAAIHQFGGTIVPRRAKRLAFPLTREAQQAGRARRWISRRGGDGGRNRPGGWRFLGSQIWSLDGEGRPQTAHWQMADSVRIPARPHVGFGRRAIKGLESIFEGALLKALEKAKT